MKVFGIIGGIGSGKSTVSALFRQYGSAIIDADIIGHQTLLLPEVKSVVKERWGARVFGEQGEIDRKKLAEIVFSDNNELAYLTSQTHPLITDEVLRQRGEYERMGMKLCLLDAPLLLEANWNHLVDRIIFVETPAEERWNRVKNRGWSKTDWQQRESAQISVEEKKSRSDIILDNSDHVEHLQIQIVRLLASSS